MVAVADLELQAGPRTGLLDIDFAVVDCTHPGMHKHVGCVWMCVILCSMLWKDQC